MDKVTRPMLKVAQITHEVMSARTILKANAMGLVHYEARETKRCERMMHPKRLPVVNGKVMAP